MRHNDSSSKAWLTAITCYARADVKLTDLRILPLEKNFILRRDFKYVAPDSLMKRPDKGPIVSQPDRIFDYARFVWIVSTNGVNNSSKFDHIIRQRLQFRNALLDFEALRHIHCILWLKSCHIPCKNLSLKGKNCRWHFAPSLLVTVSQKQLNEKNATEWPLVREIWRLKLPVATYFPHCGHTTFSHFLMDFGVLSGING